MPLIEWDKSLELGFKEFDDHHKVIFELLNKTYDKYSSGTANDGVGDVLDELIDYATYHVAAEEFWMSQQKFPGLANHQIEHEYFSHRIVELQKDFCQGRKHVALELLQFLKSWLTKHFLETDAEYGRFADALKKNGKIICLSTQ